MVWTHTSSHPVATTAVFGPWLGRILMRLRAALSPAPTAPGWPAAVIAAADQLPGTDAPGIGLRRIGRHAAATPAITPTASLGGAPGAGRHRPRSRPLLRSRRGGGLGRLCAVASQRRGSDLPRLACRSRPAVPPHRRALHATAPVWSAPQGALLLVDLDTLGGISEMTEPLMRLRLGRPDISVVLLSEEVETHDFGTERLVLADITLRLPCAFASFEFALAEAPINNAAWQERLLGDQR
ncbi:hypothetical protein ACTTAM_10945 [Rhodobacter capsulatus]|uniref:hypothetical protein n=1 Tax=Rhodobacter capsulatus TaxID=1061 RepID=UPI004026CD0A